MEETKQQPLGLRVCAELAGSFLLCFAIYAFSTWGSAVYGVNVVFMAVATGLAYAVVTAIFSRISGGQFNPAVTVAAVLASKTKLVDGILYVIAQVIGAIAAGFAVVKLLPTSAQVTSTVWLSPAVNGFEKGSVSYSLLTQYGITFSITLAIVVEVVASLIVVAAAMSTMGKNGEGSDRYTATMGIAYAIAVAISYPVTGAGLNPARSTGIAVAAVNEGLTQNPLQQLWVFWIAPVLAAAVVALVMIIVQMATTAKPKAEPTDEGDMADLEAADEQAAEDSAEDGVAEQAVEAEVRDQQADGESHADEGIERDRAYFPGALLSQCQANEPGNDGRYSNDYCGGHCVSESGNHRGDNDDDKHNPLKPGLTLVSFGNIWMIVHCGGFLICVGSLNTMAPADRSCQRELTGDGSRWTTPSLVSRDSSRQREPEVPISGRNGGYR